MLKNLIITVAALTGGFFVYAQDALGVEGPTLMSAEQTLIEEEEETCGALFGYCVDVELGQNFDITNDTNFPYALVRVNIPVGASIGESQLYLLPEIGLFYPGTFSAWYRLQAVLDSENQGVFIDAQTSEQAGTNVRTGVRFLF